MQMQADFYDVRRCEIENRAFAIEDKKIEHVSSSLDHFTVVRAFLDGGWGIVSSSSDPDEEAVLKDAIKLAKLSSKRSKKIYLKRYEIKDFKQKIEGRLLREEDELSILREIEESAKIDERIKNTKVSFSSSRMKVLYKNDHHEEFYDLCRSGYSISAIAKEDGEMQYGAEREYGIEGSDIIEGDRPHILAKKAADTSIKLLKASYPPSGKKRVILDQELGGVFIHEAVGHATEADIVLAGDSILEGKIGEKIGSEMINVYDDPTMMEYGYYPFDDEGIIPKRRALIEDGVLKGYLHNRETASVLNKEPGNGRADGDEVPIPRMSNTFIGDGDMKFEELLELVSDGVYLCGSRGGEVSTAEGLFHFNAKKGYIIRKGEIGGMVKDVSLSGNTLETLKTIVGVGNDLKINGGHCGKEGQTVPVGSGSPHLVISSCLIGGE